MEDNRDLNKKDFDEKKKSRQQESSSMSTGKKPGGKSTVKVEAEELGKSRRQLRVSGKDEKSDEEEVTNPESTTIMDMVLEEEEEDDCDDGSGDIGDIKVPNLKLKAGSGLVLPVSSSTSLESQSGFTVEGGKMSGLPLVDLADIPIPELPQKSTPLEPVDSSSQKITGFFQKLLSIFI